MAKPKDALDGLSEPITLMMASAAGDGASAPVGFPPELAMMLARKLKKEMDAEEAQEQELKRLLEARSKSFQDEIEGRARAQEWCPHRKEDGRSRVGGQRLSNGVTLYVCQYCGKEWHGNLPPGLQINLDFIGG